MRQVVSCILQRLVMQHWRCLELRAMREPRAEELSMFVDE